VYTIHSFKSGAQVVKHPWEGLAILLRSLMSTSPNLLYLAIYNPTLNPPESAPAGDEDAEEQAHILFYTSRERAVSRDRTLRQVGLAKALVSFMECVRSAISSQQVYLAEQDVW
jgi:hypothetical protein